MTVPALPADQASGAVAPESFADDVRALLAFLRDDRPIFKGRCADDDNGADPSVATATTTTFGFGGAGAFYYTPQINVGGWTVDEPAASPESLVVPEAGIYLLTAHASFDTGSAGGVQRWVRMNANGSAITGSLVRAPAAEVIANNLSSTTVVDLAANDKLTLSVYQDSGSTMDVTAYLSAIWMQST